MVETGLGVAVEMDVCVGCSDESWFRCFNRFTSSSKLLRINPSVCCESVTGKS